MPPLHMTGPTLRINSATFHRLHDVHLVIEVVNEEVQAGRVEGGESERPHCSDVGVHMQCCQAEEAAPDEPCNLCMLHLALRRAHID